MNGYTYWVHLPEHTIHQGYVGVTNNYERRWQEHIDKKHCRHFSHAIEKYSTLLIWEVIFEGPIEGCYQLEEYFRPTPGIGWNIAQGGNGGNNLNRKLSEETKAKLSKARTGKTPWNKGKTNIYSAQTLEKIGAATKIRTQGANNPMHGKSHSKEARDKMSKSRKGKPGKSGKDNSMAKAIYCITDNLHFNTITEASIYYGCSITAISLHLKHKTKTCCKKTFTYKD